MVAFGGTLTTPTCGTACCMAGSASWELTEKRGIMSASPNELSNFFFFVLF